MAIRNVRRPVGPKPPSESGDGRVYAGGSPYFNEATGTYRPGTPKDILDRVYGRGRKGDRPDRGINPPRPPRGRKPGKGDGRRTIMPVPPKGEKRPIRKPIKPINKPGVNPTKKKTGPRPSNRNDIIRNMIKPDGTRVLTTNPRKHKGWR